MVPITAAIPENTYLIEKKFQGNKEGEEGQATSEDKS
jgi:hypothetical protein